MRKVMSKPIAKQALSWAFAATLFACNGNPAGKAAKNSIFERGEPLPGDIVTGKAWHNKLFAEDSVYTTAIGVEEFEAGSRNVWHAHPGGQILIVLDGEGYHQMKGGPVQVVKKGDVLTCPPNVLHWHGASKHSGVTQMYILPNTEKGLAEWHQRVTEQEYNEAKGE